MIDDKSHYNLFEWYPTKLWRNQRVFYPWKSHVHLFQPVWLAFPASCLKLISSLSWSKTQSCWPTKNALPQMGCSSCVPGNSTLKLSWTVGKHGKMKEDDAFLDHWIGDFVGHPILGPKWIQMEELCLYGQFLWQQWAHLSCPWQLWLSYCTWKHPTNFVFPWFNIGTMPTSDWKLAKFGQEKSTN